MIPSHFVIPLFIHVCVRKSQYTSWPGTQRTQIWWKKLMQVGNGKGNKSRKNSKGDKKKRNGVAGEKEVGTRGGKG